MEIHSEARAEFLKGTNGAGVLIIHGFTGSTQSMRPLGYGLHEKGYTVSLPCLTGHGTTPEEMAKASYKDWINDVETAYKELSKKVEKVYVAGLSMGGGLTLYLAENFPVKAIATINAATKYLPKFDQLFQDPNMPDFIPGIGSDIKKEGIVEWAYSQTPKKSIGDILQIVKIVDENLSKITAPTIVFSSDDDHVVSPDNSTNIMEKISSVDKKIVHLHESYHVATLDNDFPLILGETLAFFEKHS
jgi:carboxylesterase